MSTPANSAHPYRRASGAGPSANAAGSIADLDVLIPLALLWPAFLAVVMRTIARGETFGAGTTVCGAIVILVPALCLSAWRARGRPSVAREP